MIKVRKGDIVELRINKIAYGGQGVARVDGLVIFVRGGIPGDTVTARVFRKRKGYAEAEIIELVDPSPDRIDAPCPYNGYCGGCQWQHVVYERQLEYKMEHIRESMARIGSLVDVLVHDVVPSEKRFAYRNKMEFSFSDRRWFLPNELHRREPEGGFALGLHVPGTYHKVIDVDACLLQAEMGNQILREVKGHVKDSRIPVYGLKTHEGFWRFLTIRYSNAFDEWMVNLVTSEERPEIIEPIADNISRRIKQIKTVVNNINRRKASIAVGEREVVLTGDGWINDRIGPFTFQISTNSFFQTNSRAAEKLYEKVVDYAELAGNETVLDLYSGTGTIPIFLANSVRAVTGIEMSRSAVQDARRNCKENGISNCHFLCGDIREKLSAITASKPDVLIIDPPRAGMHKTVLAQVLSLSPEKIIYISCNPATMARDIGQMIRDYQLVEIQPVDMFPHTYHIEAISKLRLRKRV
ncbi:MAG: 23S rRNA (uracil(1939)-C(5))-methyltransferase RlmD [Deltaproteobacteria bacterium]|nr:23S rRNA (uracil(1939)-C(5))-methyltransferase RlmD [Deltaproteobacteria bacterium]MBW1739072.1 23S rRNA (uracil(1939)-C(5))-methyltransferase RlmD [Deltaproteobacteria bacterium]MBW1908340.1 23S rRNA (uracil(1939)-C(5))-methyltransferase RlmD [Deltaproteobacteria bacterium]MBW2034776.1 23S rRNA (uracil(1939)-C(5))-methyltransferase RlmD [Deltaproteobacteria bacterium]